MWRGSHLATVDDKGRVKIPSDFLGELRKTGAKFYVTSATGEAAQIFPLKTWEAIEQRLAKNSTNFAVREKFLARTSYFGQVVEVDGQGRVLIPPVLREAAQMKGEVDVAGRLNYLEVWNHQRFLNKHINSNQITAEELGQLGF